MDANNVGDAQMNPGFLIETTNFECMHSTTLTRYLRIFKKRFKILILFDQRDRLVLITQGRASARITGSEKNDDIKGETAPNRIARVHPGILRHADNKTNFHQAILRNRNIDASDRNTALRSCCAASWYRRNDSADLPLFHGSLEKGSIIPTRYYVHRLWMRIKQWISNRSLAVLRYEILNWLKADAVCVRTLVTVTLYDFVAGLCEVNQRVSSSTTWKGRLGGAVFDETAPQTRTCAMV